MASLSSARKKVCSFIPNGSIRRYLSSASGKPESCYVMGKYGKIVFPGHRWQDQDDFFKENSLLSPLPAGRLFGAVDPSRPYQLLDPIRGWYRSGLSVAYTCSKYGFSIFNPFQKGNVGVIKDLGIVAFKEIKEDPFDSWPRNRGLGYKQWNEYWKATVEDMYGSRALGMLPVELDFYSQDLDNVIDAADEEFVVNHPTHLTDINYGDMSFEVYRLLMKEGPALVATATPTTPLPLNSASDILEDIGKEHPRAYVNCAAHGLMPQWYPHFLRKRVAKLSPALAQSLSLSDSEIGSLVVEVIRHGCIHSVEVQIINLVNQLFGVMNPQFTRIEVIQLLHQFFPNSLRSAYKSFIKRNAWSALCLRERYPISAIYSGPVGSQSQQ